MFRSQMQIYGCCTPQHKIVRTSESHSSGITISTVTEKLYEKIGKNQLAADWESLAGLFSKDVLIDAIGPIEVPYYGKFSGLEGLKSYCEAFQQSNVVREIHIESQLETGSEFCVRGYVVCVSSLSGKMFFSRWMHHFRIEQQKISHWTLYEDSAQAVRGHVISIGPQLSR